MRLYEVHESKMVPLSNKEELIQYALKHILIKHDICMYTEKKIG